MSGPSAGPPQAGPHPLGGSTGVPAGRGADIPGPPLWLLAELTYRCPLHCVFCYNPTDFARHEQELSTAEWVDVLRQGRALGAVQCGFSGGEPLLRDDLEELVAEAHRLGYYTNLLTSGVGLTPARAEAFRRAGLDHIQLSFQDSTRELNDFLSHTKTFALKQRVGDMLRDQGWPMVMNVVIHRLNIDHIGRIIEMAHELGAEYLELANTQYYSWAEVNRPHLIPTTEQLQRAEAITNTWREKLAGQMRLFFVAPDYHEGRPKKCMNGWGNVFLTITPDGAALPCHTARMLPGLAFPTVREMDLKTIWYDSDGFNRFRGTGWMQEPCVSCDEKEKDLGGCRCQAYMLAGDATAADPVCSKAPAHGVVRAAVEAADRGDAPAQPIVFRDRASSLRLSCGRGG
ncbi:MAG: pyrroloquinoline quinone biosynthesis protein PqqE [Proteobacteria bacterium]|nr:pyrroloquinoline quinone biosynthesis protein PqqE [Pseudomonadota bacterium]